MYVLIDANSTAYRVYHALRTTLKGRPPNPDNPQDVGLFMYMFLNTSINGVKQAVSDQWSGWASIFIWDSPDGSTPRRELYPGYKDRSKRIKNEEWNPIPFVEELKAACKMHLGVWYGIHLSKMEADDLIAILCFGISEITKQEDNAPITIITRDRDLFQLMEGNHIRVYDPFEDTLYTRDRFIEEYGFPPEGFCWYKAIAGDKSDTWPGVHLMGDKKTRPIVQALYAGNSEPYEELCKKHRKTVETGYDLVRLPFVYSDIDAALDQLILALNSPKKPDWEGLLKEYKIRQISAADCDKWLH